MQSYFHNQVNVLEEQLVWGPMGPPSANVVRDPGVGAGGELHPSSSLLGPFDPAYTTGQKPPPNTPNLAKGLLDAKNWANQMRCDVLLCWQCCFTYLAKGSNCLVQAGPHQRVQP